MMQAELTVLALSTLLLLAHILLAGHYKTRQFGTAWNTGARDEELPPLGPIAGRLERARANFLETYPIAIVGLLGVVLAGRTSDVTALAAWGWLAGRAIYLPLYWAGVPRIRTLVWGIATVALLHPILVLLLGG